jgi:hypothetical protein
MHNSNGLKHACLGPSVIESVFEIPFESSLHSSFFNCDSVL